MSIETLRAEYEAAPRTQRQGVLRKIYSALEQFNGSLIEASFDLGASWWPACSWAA